MKRSLTLLAVISIMIVFAGVCQAQKQNPNPGKDPVAATFNLSYPMITTTVIDVLYQKVEVIDPETGESEWVLVDPPTPLVVETHIADTYQGDYEGWEGEVYNTWVIDPATGCPADADSDGFPDMLYEEGLEPTVPEWLATQEPWYHQPATIPDGEDSLCATDPNLVWDWTCVDPANTWQAEWVMTDQFQQIDFVDWGNPLENIDPIVGQRFPVEIALFKILEESMTAYKVACLTLPSSRDEIFGATGSGGSYTKEMMLATVMTTNFFAEVERPDGTRTSIDLEAGMGPSGKMNFASASGGWTPDMAGVHRIWLHINDPLIGLTGAIVNNDEHYVASSGCMVEELSQQKLDKSGIIGNSTFIDVDVQRPQGKKK